MISSYHDDGLNTGSDSNKKICTYLRVPVISSWLHMLDDSEDLLSKYAKYNIKNIFQNHISIQDGLISLSLVQVSNRNLTIFIRYNYSTLAELIGVGTHWHRAINGYRHCVHK
jgi:hypothetical protein